MKLCPKCGEGHDKPGIFCSRSCANSRTFSDESKHKKSISNKMFYTLLSEDEKLNRKANAIRGYTKEVRDKIGSATRERCTRNPAEHKRISDIANSTPRKLESEAKAYIEAEFNTSNLIPEKIGSHWFDFVNDEYIIEYTIDSVGNGITNATKRFEDIQCIETETRKKYLIAPDIWFGKNRRERLLKTGARYIRKWF